jgi:hypothetical protein
VSPPISKPEVEDTCCTGDQVEPTTQAEAQKPAEHAKTASPCAECDGSLSPGQPCCDGELAHVNNQHWYNNTHT